MNRARGIAVMFFICIIAAPVAAQEKTVDNYVVNFGILSWEQIQRDVPVKPATHTEEYHYKMARETAKMHGGGKKGTYHILVVIDDKNAGRRIDNADVRVTFIGRFGPETIKLQPMTMDGFAGFGQFVRLRNEGPYVFNVFFRFSDKEAFREVRYAVQ
ncbi:MAG: hypothetical protein M0Z67_03030 [Nitrospiraceae bacterium]|nr:hypothetical protein [Nitrospiraceae bacterium]